MWWYVAIAAACAALVPWARRRSEGSLLRYSVGTGAPIVIVLIGAGALVAAAAQGTGDGDLARELFTGALIGGAFAQFVLLRRTYGIRMSQGPAERAEDADTDAGAEPDPEPDAKRAVPTE